MLNSVGGEFDSPHLEVLIVSGLRFSGARHVASSLRVNQAEASEILPRPLESSTCHPT